MAKRYHARKFFDKVAVLNKDVDAGVAGASTAKRKLSDSWTRRSNSNAGTYFKVANNKPAPCYVTKG